MEEIKICNKCKQEKNITDFRLVNNIKRGKKYYNSICRECEHIGYKIECELLKGMNKQEIKQFRENRRLEKKKKKEELLSKGKKICRQCGIEKELNEFYIRKENNGYRNECKECTCENRRNEWINNLEYRKKKKEYSKTEKVKQKTRKYLSRPEVKEKINLRQREYRKTEKWKQWRLRHQGSNEYKEKRKQYQKQPHVKLKYYQYYKNKMKTDIVFRINKLMQGAIRNSLNGNKNNRKWLSLVLYTKEELIKTIQNKFTEGMTWKKFLSGEIELDHKIPKSWFYFETSNDWQFNVCWSLWNLQPKWKNENRAKCNRYIG